VIDASPLMCKVAELAEQLEERYGPNAEVVNAVVIVEVDCDVTDDDAPLTIEHRATGSSTAHAIGLVQICADSLRAPFSRADDEDDE
jgi:hypothetical protein